MQEPREETAPGQARAKLPAPGTGDADTGATLGAGVAGINQILDCVDGAADGIDALARDFGKRALGAVLTAAQDHAQGEGAGQAARRLAVMAAKAARATAELEAGVAEISAHADRMVETLAGEDSALDALCLSASGEPGSDQAVAVAMAALEEAGGGMVVAAELLNEACRAILDEDGGEPETA